MDIICRNLASLGTCTQLSILEFQLFNFACPRTVEDLQLPFYCTMIFNKIKHYGIHFKAVTLYLVEIVNRLDEDSETELIESIKCKLTHHIEELTHITIFKDSLNSIEKLATDGSTTKEALIKLDEIHSETKTNCLHKLWDLYSDVENLIEQISESVDENTSKIINEGKLDGSDYINSYNKTLGYA